MFIYSVLNVQRNRVKSIINVLINSITIALLLCASAFTVSSFYFIDKNMNDLNGEVVYRQFELVDISKKTVVDKNVNASKLEELSNIENVEILTVDENANLHMSITVDDYRNIKAIIQDFSKNEYYNVVINDRSIFNINIINVVKAVSLIILVIVVLLTLSTISINIRKSIDERQHEIALFKAVGYNRKHLFTLIFSESILILVISFVLSLVLTKLLLIFAVNPILNKTIASNLIGRSIDINVITIIASFIICTIFVLISSIAVMYKTDRISPFILLKA